MIARRTEERGVSPEDLASIRAINEEVARKAGYLPASGKISNGTRLPC